MPVKVSRRSSSSSLSSMSLTRTRVASRAPATTFMEWGPVESRSLSRSLSTSSLLTEDSTSSWMAALTGEMSVVGHEKLTMQNLNDRLASYLEKVRSLESANMKLELQIKQFYEKRAPSAAKDHADFFSAIGSLRSQISQKFIDNQRIILSIDNAQLAANDFKQKYETEVTMTQSLTSDLVHLRGVRDGLTLSVTDLEVQNESLKEELVYMKKNHQQKGPESFMESLQTHEEPHEAPPPQEMTELRARSGDVTVDIGPAEASNLEVVLQNVREEYEALMMKNTKKLEEWFQTQMATLNTDITTRKTEANTFTTQLSELKRSYQSLEITSQGVYSEIQCLQQSLVEINRRYSTDLSQRQATISALELEVEQLRASIQQQESDYKLLLNIKMRLELEIAEYRRLLEGEDRVLIIEEKVEEIVEHKPRIEKRVKTIVEEIVDGQVVAVSTDTKVESIQ